MEKFNVPYELVEQQRMEIELLRDLLDNFVDRKDHSRVRNWLVHQVVQARAWRWEQSVAAQRQEEYADEQFAIRELAEAEGVAQ